MRSAAAGSGVLSSAEKRPEAFEGQNSLPPGGTTQGKGNRVPVLPARGRGCRGSPRASPAAEPRGAEAALSPVIDGTVQEEINSQALAGGELGGCIHLKDT